MRDISRGQNKKKRWTQICFGGKNYGVMGSSGRVGTCKIVLPLTKKSGRVFKFPISNIRENVKETFRTVIKSAIVIKKKKQKKRGSKFPMS